MDNKMKNFKVADYGLFAFLFKRSKLLYFKLLAKRLARKCLNFSYVGFKRFLVGWIFVSQILAGYSYAQSSQKQKAADSMYGAAGKYFVDSLNKYGKAFNLKWVQGSFGAKENLDLTVDLTVFSAIKETHNLLIFTQNTISNKDKAMTLNLGLGIRKLLTSSSLLKGENMILGLNAFADLQSSGNGFSNMYKRYSIGAELKTSLVNVYGNMYRRMGDDVVDSSGLFKTRVLNGYDIGVSGNVGSNIKVGLNHYRFSGDKDKKNGNKLRIEYKPNSIFTLGGEYDRPSGETKGSARLYSSFTFALDKSMEDQLKPLTVTKGDVWAKRYDKVDRVYDIYKEKIEMVRKIVAPKTLALVEGTVVSFDVKLDRPIAKGKEVKIKVASSSTNLLKLRSSGAVDSDFVTLTFTSSNYNKAQKVTVRSLTDTDKKDNNVLLQLTVDKTSTENVEGMKPVVVVVAISDANKNVSSSSLYVEKPLKVKPVSGHIKLPVADVKKILKVKSNSSSPSLTSSVASLPQTKVSDWSLYSARMGGNGLKVDSEYIYIDQSISRRASLLLTFTHPDYRYQNVGVVLQVEKVAGTDVILKGNDLRKALPLTGPVNITELDILQHLVTPNASDVVTREKSKKAVGVEEEILYKGVWKLKSLENKMNDKSITIAPGGKSFSVSKVVSKVKVAATFVSENYEGEKSVVFLVTVDKASVDDVLSLKDFHKKFDKGVTKSFEINSSDILDQLSVKGDKTIKSDWTLIDLKENSDGITVKDKTSLVISDVLDPAVEVTAKFGHARYSDKLVRFKVGATSVVPPLLSTPLAPWATAITVDKTAGQEYQIKVGDKIGSTGTLEGVTITETAKELTLDAKNGPVKGVVQTRNKGKKGDWVSSQFEFTRQPRNVKIKITPDSAPWSSSSGIDISVVPNNGGGNIDGFTYDLVDDVSTTAMGATVSKADSKVYAKSAGIVKIKATKARDDKYLETVLTKEVTFTENPGSPLLSTADLLSKSKIKSENGYRQLYPGGNYSYAQFLNLAYTDNVKFEKASVALQSGSAGAVKITPKGSGSFSVSGDEGKKFTLKFTMDGSKQYRKQEIEIKAQLSKTKADSAVPADISTSGSEVDWGEKIIIDPAGSQEFRIKPPVPKGVTFDGNRMLTSTQYAQGYIQTRLPGGTWVGDTQFTFKRKTPDASSFAYMVESGDSASWKVGAKLIPDLSKIGLGTGSITFEVVADKNKTTAKNPRLTIRGQEAWVDADGKGKVLVRVTKAEDSHYAAQQSLIAVNFSALEYSGPKPILTLSARSVGWDESITITKVSGQEYALVSSDKDGKPVDTEKPAGVILDDKKTDKVTIKTDGKKIVKGFVKARFPANDTNKASDWVYASFAFDKVKQVEFQLKNPNAKGKIGQKLPVQLADGSKGSGNGTVKFTIVTDKSTKGATISQPDKVIPVYDLEAKVRGDVVISVSKEEGDWYKKQVKEFTIFFNGKDNNDTPKSVAFPNYKGWDKDMVITKEANQEYQLKLNDKTANGSEKNVEDRTLGGVTISQTEGKVILRASKPVEAGDLFIQTRLVATDDTDPSVWSDSKVVFTKATQKPFVFNNIAPTKVGDTVTISFANGNKGSGRGDLTFTALANKDGKKLTLLGTGDSRTAKADTRGEYQIRVKRAESDLYQLQTKDINVKIVGQPYDGSDPISAVVPTGKVWNEDIVVSKSANQEYQIKVGDSAFVDVSVDSVGGITIAQTSAKIILSGANKEVKGVVQTRVKGTLKMEPSKWVGTPFVFNRKDPGALALEILTPEVDRVVDKQVKVQLVSDKKGLGTGKFEFAYDKDKSTISASVLPEGEDAATVQVSSIGTVYVTVKKLKDEEGKYTESQTSIPVVFTGKPYKGKPEAAVVPKDVGWDKEMSIAKVAGQEYQISVDGSKFVDKGTVGGVTIKQTDKNVILTANKVVSGTLRTFVPESKQTLASGASDVAFSFSKIEQPAFVILYSDRKSSRPYDKNVKVHISARGTYTYTVVNNGVILDKDTDKKTTAQGAAVDSKGLVSVRSAGSVVVKVVASGDTDYKQRTEYVTVTFTGKTASPLASDSVLASRFGVTNNRVKLGKGNIYVYRQFLTLSDDDKDVKFSFVAKTEPNAGNKVTIEKVKGIGFTVSSDSPIDAPFSITFRMTGSKEYVDQDNITINAVVSATSSSFAKPIVLDNSEKPWNKKIIITKVDGQKYRIKPPVAGGLVYDEGSGVVSSSGLAKGILQTRLDSNGSPWVGDTPFTFTSAQLGELKIVTPQPTKWEDSVQLTFEGGKDDSGDGTLTYKVDKEKTTAKNGRVSPTGGKVEADGPGVVVVTATKVADGVKYKGESSTTVRVKFKPNNVIIPVSKVIYEDRFKNSSNVVTHTFVDGAYQVEAKRTYKYTQFLPDAVASDTGITFTFVEKDSSNVNDIMGFQSNSTGFSYGGPVDAGKKFAIVVKVTGGKVYDDQEVTIPLVTK